MLRRLAENKKTNMIKFFRRIRQRLLTDNKFSKYLLYAVGEIFLVFLGIMIALYVNNKNQERAQEEEIKATLIEIQRDIAFDIGYSQYYLNNYIWRDSIKNLVMNNKVSYDDIKTNRINVYALAYFYIPMMVRTNGYQQFTNKMDKMPKKNKALLQDLTSFYGQMGSDIEMRHKRFQELAYKNADESFHEFAWFGQDKFNIKMSEEQIDFYLKDPKFKSYALHTSHKATDLTIFTIRYRTRAIEIYFKINEILGGEGFEIPDHVRNTSLVDSMQADTLVGYYKQTSGPLLSELGTLIEITALGKQLFLHTEDDENILLHYAHFEKMQFYMDKQFTSTILKFNPNENEDLTIVGGNGDERRWRKVEISNEPQ
jgi:hypothetical protein